MPQLFRFGAYVVYFWSNESEPLEPVHVHIALKKPIENGTKIWITQAGRTILANNNAKIPERQLRDLMRIIESNSNLIVQKWQQTFGEISYFC